MMTFEKPNRDALDWAILVADPEFADWDEFTVWLESDPGNSERYDVAVTALTEAEQQVAAIPTPTEAKAATSLPRRSSSSRRWTAMALAAALLGAVGLGVWTDRAQPYAVETAPGQQRTLALVDGSQIVLAGGSRVELDRAEPRFAAVAKGEMLFRVHHDDARPFHVRAGDLKMTDLGTVFDVKRAGQVTRVAVAKGAVMVDPDGAALRLDPGQAVVATGERLERQQIDPASIGSWRDGWLAFDDATLAEVADDLSRHLARPVTVAPSIARRTFRGTLDLRQASSDPALLGALLGVRVRQRSGSWALEPRR